MMMQEQFKCLANRIAALGYAEAAAAEFAALIGDTPCKDDQGRIVVSDDQGRELARLALAILGH